MEKMDELYMRRCFQLAKQALGNTYPNPIVGAVVVHNNEIIGEGFHKKAGEPHAEVHAILSVKDKSLLPFSSIYVSLEPCSHHGKTPPCADLIVESGIKHVVISNFDPNPLVAGKGVEKLRSAGIKVETGLLEEEGKYLNKRFFTSIERERPYVILKWAQSIDGFMDISREDGTKGSFQITCEESKRLVHKWRGQEQAILVGYNTIINDNPKLNTRYYSGKNPVRIVIDPKAQLEATFNVFNNDAECIIISDIKYQTEERSIKQRVFTDLSKDSVNAILQVLHERKINSVLVEGGGYTLQQFILAELWDEVRLFTGNIFMEKGMPSPSLSRRPSSSMRIGVDQLDTFYA
ncbi:MAG: bifunctional diaminohydroxyphosphoribosylaminopyrimidine deaminase/5-amino-6-(5-phosphoribosylamino)uracil reductase RibD [Flavobacteriales bacterium]